MKVVWINQLTISCLRVVSWMLCLSLMVPSGVLANQAAQQHVAPKTERSAPVFSFSGKKILKRFVEKRIKGIGKQNPDKKLSKLARAALYCFIGIFALGLLGSFVVVPLIGVLSSAAFIATVVLCILVLVDEDQNKRSRNLAKALLIVLGILTLLSIALLAVILASLAG